MLVLCEAFLPGYRAGGVLRSIANMLDWLGTEFRFRVVTRDRDEGVDVPYPDIPTGVWQPRGPAEILYLSPADLRPQVLRRLIQACDHDVLYLNSVFSRPFALIPVFLRRLRSIPARSLVVAPNGELAPSALRIKPWRKRSFLAVARLLGLFASAVWRASDQQEEAQIRACFGEAAKVVVAPNLPTPLKNEAQEPPRPPKRPGHLQLVYLSRVARVKNLAGALEMLRGLEGEVKFDLYGPETDSAYLASCERIIETLPENVVATYRGPVPSEQALDLLRQHDLFFLASHGESFGYVIPEALSAGCPVLISDRTPWRGLEEAGVGWDLPLAETERFRSVLQRCIDMAEPEHRVLRERARAYGRSLVRPAEAIEQYRALFGSAPRASS